MKVLYNLIGLFCSILLLAHAEKRAKYQDDGMCTALGVGRLAMKDLSTVTTHNADCQECDVRVTHVPARDWEAGLNKRPVFRERLAYPRLLETEENNIHGPEYLVGSEDSTIYPWEPLDPVFFVDQVNHTYAYTMGHYPLQNEKQLTMGESTCFTTFWSIPIYLGGQAKFNLRSLMEIAMERCATARCAIVTMGRYAVEYGFYAIDGDGPKAESGEGLVIGDTEEVWVFHIVADDTHASAVWVAQRVPDDHVTVIANQFIINEINLTDTDNFMASDNIFDVAVRSKLWDPASGIPFNFLHIYGLSQGVEAHGMNVRRWRAFTLAAPSLLPVYSPLTDYYATFGFGEDLNQPVPFSVKPDKALSLQDVMRIMRDNFEGTPFDLTQTPDAGPFGDVIRSGGSSIAHDPVNGLTPTQKKTMAFPVRAISIWRTTYSTIAQARSELPNDIGGVTWVAQYAPHHSTYVPVYAAVNEVPETLTNITQYKLDRSKNYWVHLVVGNYLSRWFAWTIDDVKQFQQEIEADIFSKQDKIESKAVKALGKGNRKDALSMLNEYQSEIASDVVERWWSFFYAMIPKYRDILRVDDFHAENFVNAVTWISYPRWWMEMVGFWGPPGTPATGKAAADGVRPMVFNTQASVEEYKKVYPAGVDTKYYIHSTTTPDDSNAPSDDSNPVTPPPPTPTTSSDGYSSWAIGISCFLLGIGFSYLVDFIRSNYFSKGYSRISDVSI
mmetsp:Transcript_8804/g.13172  ORF Transcript_8804/g.13172 Transcript_8804/m.13172 type:complete len:726 (+) Transcript_8804:54-2231(+)